MKPLKFLCSIFALLAVSCTGTDSLVSEGISRELALHRASTIEDLEYSLHFDLPSDLQAPVSGHVAISLNLKKRGDVILDFLPEEVNGLKVNGKASEAKFADGHIVISRSVLDKGKNLIELSFVPDDRALNRNPEYLYTLFVPARAHSVFPCFDQPDLKARFTLSLTLPQGWTAVSNAPAASASGSEICFAATEPLPTYLFSFVAGIWQSETSTVAGRRITAYHRENDKRRLSQLEDMFAEVGEALGFMEEYTGVPLPFSKYDFVIVPGFQFGGMEHPGAVLYNENTMFLSPSPTTEEREKRKQLIAHETAHMWFGDLVTMEWFDDVWTKEVFANYFAALMSEPMFPQINHDLSWLRNYIIPAMADDRTAGSVPIRQRLDNLDDAGLIYCNIIYDKAPVMMRSLVRQMGEEAFRDGIREYLREYAYSNATWDALVGILDRHSERDLVAFSNAWVYEKGLPEVVLSRQGDSLEIRQIDPLGRGVLWPQEISLDMAPTAADGSREGGRVTLMLGESPEPQRIPLQGSNLPLPSPDARFYGLVTSDPEILHAYLELLPSVSDPSARASLLNQLRENYVLLRGIDAQSFLAALENGLARELDPQLASLACSCLGLPLADLPADSRSAHEKTLLELSRSHSLPSCRLQLTRLLADVATDPGVTSAIYRIWQREDLAGFSEGDYMNLSYQLAIRMPDKAEEILRIQRARLDGSDPGRSFNADRLRQFDFVSRAASPRREVRDSLFASLLTPQGRQVEPWAGTALSLLCHSLRDESSVELIRPALDALPQVKATGDIFFPATWCRSLLASRRSPQAYDALQAWLSDNPDCPPLLLSKIRLASSSLERANEMNK